jgi:DNA repair photolyase
VRVWLSVTTLDPVLARRMEPRAAAPERRLQAIGQLANSGIPTGVLAAPMIPGLNDAELERILDAAARAGALDAGYTLLRLPLELRSMFETWLHQHYPQRAAHVLALIRQTREGRLNDSRFGQRFTGQGVQADLLAQRFALSSRKLGLDRRIPLQTAHFSVPFDPSAARGRRAGSGQDRQMALF